MHVLLLLEVKWNKNSNTTNAERYFFANNRCVCLSVSICERWMDRGRGGHWRKSFHSFLLLFGLISSNRWVRSEERACLLSSAPSGCCCFPFEPHMRLISNPIRRLPASGHHDTNNWHIREVKIASTLLKRCWLAWRHGNNMCCIWPRWPSNSAPELKVSVQIRVDITTARQHQDCGKSFQALTNLIHGRGLSKLSDFPIVSNTIK